MNHERGTALIGTLVIGFVFVLVIVQTLITVGRIGAAASDAAEVASYAAQHGARFGGPDEAARIAEGLSPDAAVVVADNGSGLTVEVRIDVPLVGPAHGPVSHTVTGQATATYSPYRSRP
jgi:hypothetical protein